jgi:hypothetical protein
VETVQVEAVVIEASEGTGDGNVGSDDEKAIETDVESGGGDDKGSEEEFGEARTELSSGMVALGITMVRSFSFG